MKRIIALVIPPHACHIVVVKTRFNPLRALYRDVSLRLTGVQVVDDPAGTKRWYKYGQLHRVGAPAVIYATGTSMWFESGVIHREGGPAIERRDGAIEFYERGVKIKGANK
ncbi:hypothetical protein UFOVP1009_51 [uncultured Caudovirales phage]|uniref:Uncharacterized protein n=1 Tax=uncultured Caudovirales phage TaxID=2100421 RepID=A0A6J5Q9X5_9CAUD|nr:hypothetical protein UFOVP1009_51 [uncultured Caudovirales phage]